MNKDEKTRIPKGILLKKIGKYLLNYKGYLVLVVILLLFSNTLLLLGPYLSGEAIDSIALVQETGDFTKIQFYCMLMIIFYIISAILTYIISLLMIKVGKNIAYELRKEIQHRLLNMNISYYDTKHAGDIISCLSYDISVLNTALTNDFIQIITSIITLILSLIMMLIISPIMVLTFLVTIPMTVLFARYRIKKTKPLFAKRSKEFGALNGFSEEVLSGLRTIIAYHKQEVMIKRFRVRNIEASDAYYKADYQGSMMGPLTTLIGNISLSLIGLIGCILFMRGQISVGNLSSFILYSRKFVSPVNELANITGEIQSAFSAANRIFTVLEEELEPADVENAVVFKDVKGDISFKDVNFGYVPEKIILKSMNLEVKSGQTIAIVGETGAGKSTIINLLMRFYDYNSGEIKIDGVPITDITRESLRKSFSMVLQDTWIFQGTIYENIAYVNENIGIEEVKRVAKAAKIDTFINALPNGYDTVITDEGSNLSKGQKQLISIARAMLIKSSILILDEATSNIDSATEILIQEAMTNLMNGKTSFVIAHRLSTIQNADRILVIGQGGIKEQGTHEELLEYQGMYYGMYQSQFL